MSTTKPIASLSLDLDNKWSYMKTHGDAGWESFPSYLDIVVPRALDFLKARNLTITFFIVGQDAALEKNHEALKSITAAGHEIGSHSFNHEPWLHLYTEQQIETELAQAEEHIESATGQRAVGFRGPGFSLSHATLRVLARRRYVYDATTFPTYLGPLARAYYFLTTRLTAEQREQRKALFGSFKEGFRPIKPYRWQTGAGELVEIPVTTIPGLRLPMHVSYLLYLGGFSPSLAMAYFRFAIRLCKLAGAQPSLLLHPLDFLGCDDNLPELAFFPGMRLPSQKKIELVSRSLELFSMSFDVLTIREHAVHMARVPDLPAVDPIFPEQTVTFAEGLK